MDVKTMLSNGLVKEEIYIEQLKGFGTYNRETCTCRFKRAFYGLKQAP